MQEKTVNEVVKEFKQAFGEVEFMAERNADGLQVASKGWQASQPMALAMDANDYLALGKLNVNQQPPAQGVISYLLARMGAKKAKA